MSRPLYAFCRGGLIGILVFVFACLPPGYYPGPSRPEAAKALYQEAETLYQAHRYEEALSRFDQYLRIYPHGKDAHRAWLRSATLLGIRGQWARAQKRYEQLLRQQPERAVALQARYGLGQACWKQGNYQAANQILQKLLAEDLPPEVRFRSNALLAEIALKLGDVSTAFAYLHSAAKDLDMGDKEWFRDLKIRLLEQAQSSELEKLAAQYPESPLSASVLLHLAKLALQRGQTEQAREWLATLNQRFPGSPEAAQGAELLPPESTPVTAATGPTLGCLLPLSGEFAAAGHQVQQGMALAAAETGVEVIYEDCRNDPHLAAQAVDAMAHQERILALIGPLTSVTAEAAAQAAQRQEIPIITLTQKEGITAIGDLVFRDFLTSRMQVKALLTHAVIRLGFRRFAVLYPLSPYGQTFLRLFNEEVANHGGILAFQASYPDGIRDFSEPIATLAAAHRPEAMSPPGFDALFIPDEAAMVAALAVQLAASPAAGIQLLGTNLMHSPVALENASVLSGILFPDAFFIHDPAPAVKAFVESYRERYTQNPTYLAAQGYSAVKLLAEVLKANPGLTRAEFARRLAEWRPVSEVPFSQGFDHQREAELEIKILTIRDGQFQLAP